MPHWEHGYRTHGYWASASERLGAVGLGPRGRWDGVYRWSVDRTGEAGEATTLRQAKREVEQRTGGANTSEKSQSWGWLHNIGAMR